MTSLPSCSLLPSRETAHISFTNKDLQGSDRFLQIFRDDELIFNKWLVANESTGPVTDLDDDDIIIWSGHEYPVGAYHHVNWCTTPVTTTTTVIPTTTTTVAPTTTTTEQPATTTTEDVLVEATVVTVPPPTPSTAPPTLVPLPTVPVSVAGISQTRELDTISTVAARQPTAPSNFATTGIDGMWVMLVIVALLIAAGCTALLPTLLKKFRHS